MCDQPPKENHHDVLGPSPPGYLAVLLAELPQRPIDHRGPLHAEGPFRDCARRPSVQEVIADYEKTKKPAATNFVNVGRI
jgi:hypothetical protein